MRLRMTLKTWLIVAVGWRTATGRPGLVRRLWTIHSWYKLHQITRTRALRLARAQLAGGARGRIVYDVYRALLQPVRGYNPGEPRLQMPVMLDDKTSLPELVEIVDARGRAVAS